MEIESSTGKRRGKRQRSGQRARRSSQHVSAAKSGGDPLLADEVWLAMTGAERAAAEEEDDIEKELGDLYATQVSHPSPPPSPSHAASESASEASDGEESGERGARAVTVKRRRVGGGGGAGAENERSSAARTELAPLTASPLPGGELILFTVTFCANPANDWT